MSTAEIITLIVVVIMIMCYIWIILSEVKKLDKDNQPKKPENWYWEKRTDFTGKTYYFPKHREQHTCKCNHFKNHRHDISGQD